MAEKRRGRCRRKFVLYMYSYRDIREKEREREREGERVCVCVRWQRMDWVSNPNWNRIGSNCIPLCLMSFYHWLLVASPNETYKQLRQWWVHVFAAAATNASPGGWNRNLAETTLTTTVAETPLKHASPLR